MDWRQETVVLKQKAQVLHAVVYSQYREEGDNLKGTERTLLPEVA